MEGEMESKRVITVMGTFNNAMSHVYCSVFFQFLYI